jgi:hypothetical protein
MTGLEREVQINHADKGFVAMHAAAHLALLQAAPAVFFERTVKIASSLCGMQAAGLYLSEDGKVVPRAVHERTQVKWPEACHTLAANVVRSALCDEQTLSPVVLEEKSAGSDEEPLRLVGIPLANRAREVFGALLLVGPGEDEFAEDQFQSLEVLGSCISCDMESLVELFRRERAARRVQSVQRLGILVVGAGAGAFPGSASGGGSL